MNRPDEPIANQERRPKTKDIPIVNLNTATVEELSRLPGIAARLAGRIIDYRTKVHPFRETAEITQVRGISPALYAGIADLLTVGPAEPEAPALVIEPEAPILPAELEAPIPVVEAESPHADVRLEVPASVVEPQEPAAEVKPDMPALAAEPKTQVAATRELPPTPPRARLQPAPEPKRGIGWPALLAACLASAIAGACLALLLLLAINGTLRFGPDAAVSELGTRARQMNLQAERLTTGFSQLQGSLDEVDGRLDEVDGRLDEADNRMATAQAELKAVREEMARVGADVQTFQDWFRAIETQFGGLTEDLQAVRQATRRFDAFLSGLRDLIDQSQGSTPTATPLPQAPSPTRKPGLTVVPQPTSTPKP